MRNGCVSGPSKRLFVSANLPGFCRDPNQYFSTLVVAINPFWNYKGETYQNIGDLVGAVGIELFVALKTRKSGQIRDDWVTTRFDGCSSCLTN